MIELIKDKINVNRVKQDRRKLSKKLKNDIKDNTEVNIRRNK